MKRFKLPPPRDLPFNQLSMREIVQQLLNRKYRMPMANRISSLRTVLPMFNANVVRDEDVARQLQDPEDDFSRIVVAERALIKRADAFLVSALKRRRGRAPYPAHGVGTEVTL